MSVCLSPQRCVPFSALLSSSLLFSALLSSLLFHSHHTVYCPPPGPSSIFTQTEAPAAGLRYELEAAKFVSVTFTLNFAGSENVEVQGAARGSMQTTTEVNPFERRQVAVLRVKDVHKGWGTKVRFSWTESQPDVPAVKAAVADDAAQLEKVMAVARRAGFDADSLSVPAIERLCRDNRVKFVDLEFPPTPRSLYKPGSPQLAKDVLVTWRRAGDFLEPGFAVFESGVLPTDCRQGLLGDCWLMCALAALAEVPEFVENAFRLPDGTMQPMQSPYGVYSVRLCKNGSWQWVRLDSYFPCSPFAGPCYSKAHGNELWVMLLEKAFAKVTGAYEVLEGGFAYEAMQDITGCPCTRLYLDRDPTAADVESGALFDTLSTYDARGYLMSASTPGEDTWSQTGQVPTGGPGLVTGHAYTLLQARKTSRGDKLLQVRALLDVVGC